MFSSEGLTRSSGPRFAEGTSMVLTRGGGSPYMRYKQMCHLTGMVWRKIALHKGPNLKFCITKGSLFCPKSALQKGPFLLKIEVSPLKNACFANFKRKIFWKSSKSYILDTFCLLFLKFALKKGQNFGADAPYRRVGFAIHNWHTRVQKSGKNPPPPGDLFTWDGYVEIT